MRLRRALFLLAAAISGTVAARLPVPASREVGAPAVSPRQDPPIESPTPGVTPTPALTPTPAPTPTPVITPTPTSNPDSLILRRTPRAEE